ncbi:uncharacterized protein HaLaN_28367 [Haematococcus lacustris]|uniref:Uncharacterized protein n=1 Tax=Haematococcus lacustris TaxID=44745 RepID=A0A6A0ABN9_HAELA|nr:uncharacterized protein HaLaN_28367 [Haematococcus lacustris]
MAIRAFEASSTSSSKLSVQQSKELLHEVRSMTRGSIKAAVNRSLGQQLVCVAHTLHSLLAEIRGAGLGLFLEGSVAAGALVAVVPGISYLRTQLQHMPHFPQVSLHNDFLSCRFDMTILDSKAWGAGAQHLGQTCPCP